MTYTIEELRAARDHWPIVHAHIPEAITRINEALGAILTRSDLEEHLERKFRKGEAEHNGAWLDADSPDWLINEAAEEILDFLLYQAMFLVLTNTTTPTD